MKVNISFLRDCLKILELASETLLDGIIIASYLNHPAAIKSLEASISIFKRAVDRVFMVLAKGGLNV